MTTPEQRRKRERITVAAVVVFATLLVYGATAWRLGIFPFPPKQAPAAPANSAIDPEMGDINLQLQDLDSLEKRATKLLGTDRRRVDLFFTGSNRGEIDPIGCGSSPSGGISQCAYYMNLAKQKTPTQIRVNGGNAITADRYTDDADIRRMRTKALAFFTYFEAAGFDALNVGRLELALGTDFLLDEARKHDLPYVSANLRNVETRQPMFPPYRIVERFGVTFAFVGLFPETIMEDDKDAKAKLKQWEHDRGIAVDPADEVLPSVLADLESQNVDIIMVLSARALTEDWQTMDHPDGRVDFFLNSGGFEASPKPAITGDTSTLASGAQGSHVVHVPIYLSASGPYHPVKYLYQDYDITEDLLSLNKRLEEVNAEIVRLRKEMADAGGASSWEEVRNKLVSRENVRKGVYEQIQVKVAKLKQVPPISPDNNYYWVRMQPLHHNMLPDTTLEPLLQPLREAFFNTEFDPAYGGVPVNVGWGIMGKGEHAGVSTCYECHPNVVKLWKKTAHARAYAKLPAEDRSKEECLVCHVTGWLRKKAVTSAQDVPKGFDSVGCEACHGPGALHARTMAKDEPHPNSFIQRKVSTALCATCHRGFHNETFDATAAMERISCTELAKAAGVDITPKTAAKKAPKRKNDTGAKPRKP